MRMDKGDTLLAVGVAVTILIAFGWIKVIQFGKRQTDSQEVHDEQ